MVTDGVDLGLVLPVHGALRGRSFLLATSLAHIKFPWQGAPGVGSGETQWFWGAHGAYLRGGAHPHPRKPQRGRPGGHHAASGMGGPPPRCGPGPPPPLHPPSPPPVAPGHPPPSLGHRRCLPGPPLPPPPHQEGAGQRQGKGKGHQGAHRQEGTEGPQVRAATRRERAPAATPHGGRKPPKNQDGAGTGTKTRRTRAPRRAPRPTPRKGTPQRGDQRRPSPTKHPNTHHRSKHRTPYGTHQRTPTGHRKPHGERGAHLQGEYGPHPQRKPQGTPPHGAPPRPHHQATTPTRHQKRTKPRPRHPRLRTPR